MGCVLSTMPSASAGEAPAPRSPGACGGWPPWLVAVAGDALQGWAPRRADAFEKIAKIGSGTYSNVYKAWEVGSSKDQVVALKKVRFEAGEMESARFMVREIAVLRHIGAHPNIVHLQGIACSRVSSSLYLVFEYLDHEFTGIATAHSAGFSLPQVKCYMKQLLAGLDHCHSHGILHRDIKGSNLLLNNEGVLKIADFGLASTFDLGSKQPMTSQVVTLWYRAPELLLGSTRYGVGVDLWSAGCILAELLVGKPILPGRSEVEQLHRIFKLCGSPSEKYWKKSKLPHASVVKPRESYKSCIAETFKDYPPSVVSLIEQLLAIDPDERGTAFAALNSEFFTTEPHACEPSCLPRYPPSKEMDVRLLDDKTRRQGMTDARASCQAIKRAHTEIQRSQAAPAPEANAELQVNLNASTQFGFFTFGQSIASQEKLCMLSLLQRCKKWRATAPVSGLSKSEKFPPPHQDGAVGSAMDHQRNGLLSFVRSDASFASSVLEPSGISPFLSHASTASPFRDSEGRKSTARKLRSIKPSTGGMLMELRSNTKFCKRE